MRNRKIFQLFSTLENGKLLPLLNSSIKEDFMGGLHRTGSTCLNPYRRLYLNGYRLDERRTKTC
jgi:hypothetical protein